MSRAVALNRRPLAFAGAGATALIVATSIAVGGAGHAATTAKGEAAAKLPVKQIEKIEQAQGDYSSGVLAIDIDREHRMPTGPGKITFKTGFQIMHELHFQMLSSSTAAFNGDVAIKNDEKEHVIDAIQANHLVFQAEHQHYTDIHPEWWFIHFRGTGAPRTLAEEVHQVVLATHVPLPQTMPKHPETPLPAKQLGKILGGDETVGEHGVVSVSVDRTDAIRLGGHRISDELGVSTDVQFQPLGKDKALVIPDFSMRSSEVAPVTRVMRRLGWDDECLYNQEIGESPQLFYSHMYKIGDARVLAGQIRSALNHTRAAKSSS
jgi:hypothetical protein